MTPYSESDFEKMADILLEHGWDAMQYPECIKDLAIALSTLRQEKDVEIERLKKEIEDLKQKPKIMVSSFEIKLETFKDIVKYIGRCWGSPSRAQSLPDEIYFSAILEWQIDGEGLFAITSSGKKVRLSNEMPAMKIALVKI